MVFIHCAGRIAGGDLAAIEKDGFSSPESAPGEGGRKVSTSFFEKKEAKKLLIPLFRTGETTADQIKKVFCFFFSKKKRFP